MKKRQFYFWLGLLLWVPTIAKAAGPAWWTTSGAVKTNETANDYAVINLGQLKNMATQAKAEMDANLPGGAGSNVIALINGFSPTTNNYFAANIGQLKYVAKPFYDRLAAVGYTNAYPWTGGTNDYAVANVGQLKYLFSWDISTNTVGDGIPDWWKLKYGFSITDTNVATSDSDTDGWSNLEEYLNDTSPLQADAGITNFDFIVNGGQLYSTSLTVSVHGVNTNYPKMLVNLDPTISNGTVLANSGTQNYTLPDNGDGIYELFLQYAVSFEQPIGPILSKVVNIDRTAPVVYITSPASTAVLNQAFMTLQAVAYDRDPVAPSPSRPISIFINGQQFWDRSGTNINIDLFPVPSGTNSFTVTIRVTDQAGNSNQTSRTWTVDPSTATNAPNILTVNITTNMLLPDVESIWVEGDVDNAYALVNALVSSESGDVTTNSLNVWKAHYEGLVPLESGTNQIFLIAANAAGTMTSKSFTAIRSTRFQAAITNPVFGVFATVPSNTVSGYVSALFDAGLPTQTNITSVLINGVPALLGTNIDGNGNVSFWTTNYIPPGTPITGTVGGPGIPTDPAPTQSPGESQVYEVTHKVQINDDIIQLPRPSDLKHNDTFDFFGSFWNLLEYPGCWSPEMERQVATVTQDLVVASSNVQSNRSVRSDSPPGCLITFDPDNMAWSNGIPSVTSATVSSPISRGLYFGTFEYDHGPGTLSSLDWNGHLSPCGFKLDKTNYRTLQRQLDAASIRFRAPREYDTNTTVIFTFEGIDYRRLDGKLLDLSQIKFHGQNPIAYSNGAQTVSYLLTVDGGKEYEINEDDFQWPSDQQLHHRSQSYQDTRDCPFVKQWNFAGDWTENMHWLSWTNFHNATSVLLLIYKLPADDGTIDWTWVSNEMNKKSTNLVVQVVTSQPANWQTGDMTNYKVNGVYQWQGKNYIHMWGIQAEGDGMETGLTAPLGHGDNWAAVVYTPRVHNAYERDELLGILPEWVTEQGEDLNVKNWSSVGIMHEMYHAVGLYHPVFSGTNTDGSLFLNEEGSYLWFKKQYRDNRGGDFLKKLGVN